MEIEKAYQNRVKEGDSERNKFAIASLVISIISLIFSLIMIPQIIGLIFAILGMKSEKKGISIAGLIISIIAILLGVIAIISLSMFSGILSDTQIRADERGAVEIQSAIVQYIEDSGDIELKFGENQSPTVKKVISNLQDVTIVNGQEFGPYLESSEESEFELMHPDHKGWEIFVNETNATVEVKPSELGDMVLIQ
ncbi:hypothetical protein RBH29_09505 [Herbivorax sp. ANBcel31]|uniref:hypothetical protein n=1 Tax=Herbivorax sp. ANBcel31 TaxID=3069754 RepID=UPI0027B1B7B3|nr:hypothetical protein [Herbivorax sp. ANBcel31]MDQ2086659.1 hypothetical protein [Herbivorax sp. ANBcel31]